MVVVGAGPAGEVAAGRLAEHGLQVAIVEDRLVGGECSFWACMPSKALLRPYEALAELRRIPGAAQAVTGELDVPAVLARRDEVIHDLDDSAQLPWLEDRGVTLLRGWGKLSGERRVTVGDEEIEARRAVMLAGGSTPTMPPIEGLDAIDGAWTNREATTAKEIPERLVVMGGGVVGVEMSQAFQTLGSQVTLIEGERRLLPREEEFACAQVTEALDGARRRHPHAARRRSGSSRTAARSRSARPSGPDADRRRAARRARAHAADRGPRAGDGRAAAGRDDRRRRPHARPRRTTGCSRSATSTAARCSPTWASTRRASPPTRSSATTTRSPTAPTARSPRA